VGVPNQAEEWAQATQEFLHNTPEGRAWAGGSNNLQILGWLLRENGLADAEDKLAALKSVAAEMKDRGLDVSPEQPTKVDANSSPAEILRKWKSALGDDPARIGEAFRKFFTK
jgi:hypothetical protein